MIPSNVTATLYHQKTTSGTDVFDTSAYLSAAPALLMPVDAALIAIEDSGVPASELWSLRLDGVQAAKMGDKVVTAGNYVGTFIVTGIRLSTTNRLPNTKLTVRQKWGS